jgi:hypothetical protein
MQSVVDLKEKFTNLSYDNQIDWLIYANCVLQKDDNEKLTLKEAAEQLKGFYENDEELTQKF